MKKETDQTIKYHVIELDLDEATVNKLELLGIKWIVNDRAELINYAANKILKEAISDDLEKKLKEIKSGVIDDTPKRSKILTNKIQCKKCKDIIESTFCHEFVWCKCKSVAVDGGLEYLRRVGEPENYKDMSKIKKQ